MGIILGLCAALGWGVADLFARFASHRIGAYRTLIYMQPLAFLALSVFVLITEGNKAATWELWALGLAALISAGNTIAGLSLYRAFEIGTLSLVSPIAASYGAITLLLSILSGERPSPSQLAGLVVTVIGVVVASASFGPAGPVEGEKASGGKFARGVGWAVVASVAFGVAFWGFRFVTPNLGGVVPIWESRLVGPLLLVILARPARQSIKLPERSAWKWVLAVGIIDTLAFLSYTIGVAQSGETGVVAVLSSLFSAVTIVLARIFLKEKLAPSQWAGIGLILLGIGLVSFNF